MPAAARVARLAHAARLLLVPYLVAVGLIVFLPADSAQVGGIVAWLADGAASLGMPRAEAATVIEFTLNIVLFVPFGVLVALAWRALPPALVIALGGATSLAIEFVQMALPTRYPTVSDLVANTLGTVVGCLVVAVVTAAAQRTQQTG